MVSLDSKKAGVSQAKLWLQDEAGQFDFKPKKLNFRRFSKILLETGDIDPDYIFMREKATELGWDGEKLFNWVLHKLVVYDSVSELQILLNKASFADVKYGNERNKHRNHAVEYLLNMKQFFYKKNVKDFFNRPGQVIFNDICTVKGFGPWSAWKFMDLMSCVYGLDVDFDGIDFRKSYEFPLKGLLMINDYPEDVKLLKDDGVYKECIDMAWALLKYPNYDKITPHNNNKGVRMNELETLLCKYHSYIHGHYYPGKDLEHLQKRIKTL